MAHPCTSINSLTPPPPPPAPRAEGDFKTSSNGLHYLVHHFNYTDQTALLTLAKSKTLYIDSISVDGYLSHLRCLLRRESLNSTFSLSYIKMTITFDVVDRFQENKGFQTAQTMNNILRTNTKWWLCHHGNRDLQIRSSEKHLFGLNHSNYAVKTDYF